MTLSRGAYTCISICLVQTSTIRITSINAIYIFMFVLYTSAFPQLSWNHFSESIFALAVPLNYSLRTRYNTAKAFVVNSTKRNDSRACNRLFSYVLILLLTYYLLCIFNVCISAVQLTKNASSQLISHVTRSIAFVCICLHVCKSCARIGTRKTLKRCTRRENACRSFYITLVRDKENKEIDNRPNAYAKLVCACT